MGKVLPNRTLDRNSFYVGVCLYNRKHTKLIFLNGIFLFQFKGKSRFPQKEFYNIDNRTQYFFPCHFCRSICGPYLDPDKRESPNYKVVVGDAIKFMEELVVNIFKKFDSK